MATEDSIKKQAAFAQTFYEEVESIIGGDNSQEQLCLMLPGIVLNKKDYAYNEVKSPTVEANESRLANKLYDPEKLTGADNGMTLPTQYMSALNALTPKINSFIATAKNKLRELLMKKYPFTFEYADGTSAYNPDSTFQEVYFHLYNDYLETAKAWALKQSQQKKDLGAGSDEYLVWYQDNAEAELNIINQKRAKLLAIFSPNDMKILEGVLDSGSGAELQEARQVLNNLKKLNPDGSYTYPVKFYPSDWHKYLNTSFTPVDLLNSPEKITDEIRLMVSRRTSITYQLNAIKAQLPEAKDLEAATTAANKAEEEWNTAFNAMAMAGEQAGIDFIITTVKSICSVCDATSQAEEVLKNISAKDKEKEDKTVSDSITEKTAGLMKKAADDSKSSENSFFNNLMSKATADQKVDLSKVNKDELNAIASGKGTPAMTAAQAVSKVVSEVFGAIQDGAKKVDEAQNTLMSKISNYLKTEAYATKLANRTQLKTTLLMLGQQLETISNKIEELRSNFAISIQTKGSSSVEPPTIPEGYSQCFISHDMSSTKTSDLSYTSVVRKNSKKGFWIFKKSSSETSTSSYFSSFCEDNSTNISIGMNIAKVTIEREWFNPGLFQLTKNMYSLANGVKISLGDDAFDDSDKANNCILPCYPTALVVARDITIKITNTGAKGQALATSASRETSSSSSFFVFHSGSGSSSEASFNSSSSTFDGNTITMKFATPQVIGMYLHATPEDNSETYPLDDESKDIDTITKFVDTYKTLLDSYIETSGNAAKA